jgi:hypothetical protein
MKKAKKEKAEPKRPTKSERKTMERLRTVVARLMLCCEEKPDIAKDFSLALEDFLDDLGDAFGTEGQCDPRGDMRDYPWHMDFVEGVDE